jgi:hypothetical protein
MTKEELYTAIESANSRGATIASELKAIEENYTGDELITQIDYINLTVENLLTGDEDVKANVVTLCDMIRENG